MSNRVRRAVVFVTLVLTTAAAPAADVTLTITSPAPGKTVASPYFSAQLPGLTQSVVVRVDCAGATHFIMVNPIPPGPPPRPGQRPREPIASDSWLPCVVGQQELSASVLSKDGKELLAKQTVTFTVEAKSDAELASGMWGFQRAYDMLNGGADALSETWRNFCNSIDNACRYDKPENWEAVRYQAKLYLAMRSNEFHARLNAYADLADTYANAGRPADSLRAAQEADRIYEAEKRNTTAGEYFLYFPVIYDPRPAQNVGSPAHFARMARLHLMRNDLDGALAWYEKAIEFQTTQAQQFHLDFGAKQRCRAEAATICRQAAGMVFLLTNDLAKQQQWLDRANSLSTENAEGGRALDLLGQPKISP